jgi:N-acetylmuramoyl-L-alanine amidase
LAGESVPETKPTEHFTDETPSITSTAGAEKKSAALPVFVSPAKSARSEQLSPQQAPPPPRKEHHIMLITAVSALRSLIITFAAAVSAATIFTWWTSPDFLSAGTQRNLAVVVAQATSERNAATPTALPTPVWFNRIGIIAGHSGIATYGPTKGNVDPGTVCPDGFNEASVAMSVARQVVAILRGRGFTVDLLEEWDAKLDGYQAAALVSLHADSCENFNDGYNHSGFKSTYPTERYTSRDRDLRLDACIRQNYASSTGLQFQPGSITVNMTKYHAFHQIAPSTAAVILELGFLSYDRDLLQNHTDKLAQGIVNGLLCYLEPATQPTAMASVQAPAPSPTP